MKVLENCFGHQVRLTDERFAHVAEHPEMAGMEAYFLEVRFPHAPGYEKATSRDAVMERVDAQGNVIVFSTLGVSQHRKSKPLEADLVAG